MRRRPVPAPDRPSPAARPPAVPHLVVVSLVWALSFGLIKGRLVGLDSAFITAVRLGLALLVFLPFLRLGGLAPRRALALMAIGGVQFGLMYLAYNESFRHLQAHEVALLTLTTPVWVTLLADALDRRWHPRSLAAALVAVAGTAIVVFQDKALAPTLAGAAWVQLSNLAFAAGQVGYRHWRAAEPAARDHEVFALLCAGGTLVALAVLLASAAGGGTRLPASLDLSQALTLLYLGLVASGLGFFLWNVGATRVSAGQLAVMNNAKIPLAVAASLLVFGERADPLRLLASLAVLGAAVWLADRAPPAPAGADAAVPRARGSAPLA